MKNQIAELRDKLNNYYGKEVFLFTDEQEDTIFNLYSRYEGNDMHIDFVDGIFEYRVSGYRADFLNLDEVYNDIIENYTFDELEGKQLVYINGYTCAVEIENYQVDNSVALVLVDIQDGQQYAIASIWTEGLEKDEIAIKNYSENEGVLDALIDANIVDKPHRYINSGYVNLPIVRLNKDFIY